MTSLKAKSMQISIYLIEWCAIFFCQFSNRLHVQLLQISPIYYSTISGNSVIIFVFYSYFNSQNEFMNIFSLLICISYKKNIKNTLTWYIINSLPVDIDHLFMIEHNSVLVHLLKFPINQENIHLDFSSLRRILKMWWYSKSSKNLS